MADFVMTHDLDKLSQKMNKRMKEVPGVKARILRDIGSYMAVETKRRFDNQVSPDGTPWKPISSLTADARKQGSGRAGSGSPAAHPQNQTR